ncbi:Hypothetical_protein [Hexamita inflata]|uniref:Hypothetical_protein n=1 Tax=Hexamita inflata TaxID=28002 RepID=A0AA86R2Q8_9EUKA|nr:Hypothetical protein HINF_LOCUS52493 [Hexamita inflata]
MTDNLQETLKNFATLAFEHLRQMDGPSVVRAINTISKELSIDEHTTQLYLSYILKYQEEAFYEQLRQKILLMYQETSSIQYPSFPFFKPPIPPANSLKESKMKDHQPIPNENQSFNKTKYTIQQNDSILSKTTIFNNQNNYNAKKNQERSRIYLPLNGIRKRNLFRTALMKAFKVENVTDLELCQLVKESKTSRWKQMSRYIQCMSTKQVSDYFWKTFMNGAKK